MAEAKAMGNGSEEDPAAAAAEEEEVVLKTTGSRSRREMSPQEKNYDPGQGITITLQNVSYIVEITKREKNKTPENQDKLSSSLSQSKLWLEEKCCLRRPKLKKMVLHSITGNINAGEMYALLGPSGAGKTTLLDVISRRKTVGEMAGEILFDGKKVSKLRLKTETAYIQQQDVLLGYFTVFEYILFHAFLKLPSWISNEQKRDRCLYSIDKLGLNKCMHSRIGEPMKRGVSGGERKRVCIALGLLTEPKCLFLDEPTSGLDSHISMEVMRTVKSLSNDGRTIICTIHQPSQVIYNLFDKLILLRNGSVAYWGTGKDVAKGFFEKLGFHSDEYDNSAEYLLDVVSGALESTKGYTSEDLSNLFAMAAKCTKAPEEQAKDSTIESHAIEDDSKSAREHYPESCEDVVKTQEENCEEEEEEEADSDRMTTTYHNSQGYANGNFAELGILIAFKAKAHFKDPHFIGTRMVCPLLFSLILASFWGTPIEAANDFSTGQILELAGLLFIIVGTNAFMTTFFVPAIMEERPVFIKERHDACYRVSSYVLHKVIIEAIANVPGVILFSVPIYFATPLMKEAGMFFFFMLTLFILNLCSSMMALAIASVSPTMEIAGALVPAILSLCALAGGFLQNLESLPVWWQWFNAVDFIAWAFSALMMNQYQNRVWWYCLPPLELSSFLTGAGSSSSTNERTGSKSDLGGALSLLGDNGMFEAKCEQTAQPTQYIDLDLQQCMLPVAMEVADSCFPPDFQISQILSCNEICAPIQGDSVLKYFTMEWRYNRWISLGILAGHVPVFFAVFYLATRFMRHESR
jgi:ABC-type multidrug transport system ATPase subunit/ABC-type multidrug transport system permease subunit